MRTLPIWRFSVKPDSRFRRHEPPTAPVSITWQGETLTAEAGESLAAALLAAGVDSFRSHPRDRGPRGPYCLMGSCFECLVIVDGMPSVQACMTPVRDGLQAEPQQGGAALDDG